MYSIFKAAVTSGFNGTIFAYGQTGGGKTWTMEVLFAYMQGPNHHDAEFKGLIPRTIEGLFESIASSDESL
jgi:kinesin family protein 5